MWKANFDLKAALLDVVFYLHYIFILAKGNFH